MGALAGKKLQQRPARIVSWGEFQDEHPPALVLDKETGFTREYGANPYAGYDDVD